MKFAQNTYLVDDRGTNFILRISPQFEKNLRSVTGKFISPVDKEGNPIINPDTPYSLHFARLSIDPQLISGG